MKVSPIQFKRGERVIVRLRNANGVLVPHVGKVTVVRDGIVKVKVPTFARGIAFSPAKVQPMPDHPFDGFGSECEKCGVEGEVHGD